MEEEIKADLFEPAEKDTRRFVNLLDAGKWDHLIKEYDAGKGKPLDELLEDLLEGR